MQDRRHFHKSLLATSGSLLLHPLGKAVGAEAPGALIRPVGVCDWTIAQRYQLAAFDTAKDLGLEGVQVSFGEPGTEMDLRDKAQREALFAKAEESGVRVASLGMGTLNKFPYASHAEAEQWVADCVGVMAAMRTEFPDAAPDVALLAFFGKGDLKDDAAGMAEVIARLKKVAPGAEEAGMVFGIESMLDRAEHEQIMDGVGSPAVQVYYDTANSNRAGYDIYDEVAKLGEERICQIHLKENGARITEGEVDFPKFKGVLDEIGYAGWLIIEGSRVKGNALLDDYRANTKATYEVFGRKGG